MGDGTINLPQVIQQSVEVSRLQETVQRAGEQQQAAAAAERLRQERREQASVQRSQRIGTQNRVRTGEKDGQSPRRQPHRAAPAAKPAQPQDELPADLDGGGGVLDVVV